MRFFYANLAGFILLFCLAAVSLHASPTGTISGRVSDANNAPIPDARVEITNINNNQTIRATTNDDGFYIYAELVPGAYRVRVSKSGFQISTRESVVLNVSANVRLNFRLEAGQISETVTIAADSREMVETDSAAVGTLVDRKFVENLPLNGRSFQSLIE